MVMGISSIVETEEDFELGNKELGTKPKDARAHHVKTLKELDLFKFSSDYQTFGSGMSNLENETGLHCGGSSDFTLE